MRLLALMVMLALPAAVFAAEDNPASKAPAPQAQMSGAKLVGPEEVEPPKPVSTPATHLEAAKKYYASLGLTEEHTQLYQEANKKLLATVIINRPCIPEAVLDRYKEIGEFPEADFEKYYEERIMTKLTEDDLIMLTDFYKNTHVGKFFINWRREHSGKETSVIPLENKMDKQLYVPYEPVVQKENAVMAILARQGKLLPEDIRQKNDQRIADDIAKLVQPYLDADGNCK